MAADHDCYFHPSVGRSNSAGDFQLRANVLHGDRQRGRHGIPFWQWDLLRDVSLGDEFYLSVDVFTAVSAAAFGLAKKGIRGRRAKNRTGSVRYRVVRPVVERRSKWTYDFLVGAAPDQLAAVLWASDRHYVELSQERS